MACRWWPNIESWLGSFAFVQGIRTSISKKPYIFCDFTVGGGGLDPCNPSGSAHSFVVRIQQSKAIFLMARPIFNMRRLWVRCTINRSHSTPCKKAEFEHLQIFPGHCLDFFLSVSGKICHSPIKKVKRQPTLIISFSQHSPFFGEQSKNPGWNPTRVRRHLGSAPGSLWQNSPHKDAFFCISLTNIDQCWITCTFKVE